MIDRFGKQIRVGWSDAETLWLVAAMGLPLGERSAAYLDISEMTGRSFAAITWMAGRHRYIARERGRQERLAADKSAYIAPPPIPLAPSTLNTGPRMQKMRMGARA